MDQPEIVNSSDVRQKAIREQVADGKTFIVKHYTDEFAVLMPLPKTAEQCIRGMQMYAGLYLKTVSEGEADERRDEVERSG